MKTGILTFVFGLTLALGAQADSTTKASAAQPPAKASAAKSSVLQKTLDKYAQAQSLQADIKKIDDKVVLGTKSESQGQMKYQNKKIHIVLNSEKKVEFFYSNQTVVLVEYPDADFAKDGARKVTTLKKSIPPFLEGLLNLFSNPKSFNKSFRVVSEKIDQNIATIDLQPEQKNIKSLSLKIDTKTNLLTQILFVDDAETKTSIDLTNTVLNKKIDKNEFTFVKQKTDEEMKE